MKPKKLTGPIPLFNEIGKQWGYKIGDIDFYIGETSNHKYKAFTMDHGIEANDYKEFLTKEAAREYLGKKFKELKGKRFYVLN